MQPRIPMALFEEAARSNPAYVDALYREYVRDPDSVPADWRLLFEGYEFGVTVRRESAPASPVARLVHAYRELGHLVADLDPLGQSPRTHPLLDLEALGIAESALDDVVEWQPFRGGERGPLRELLAALRETYAGALAVEYLCLLLEGTAVRLSGQDSVRGTFSHRHAALFDLKDGHAWIPLNHVAPGQAELEAVNSPLSGLAVLGFEYGMSSADPRRLVVWEAQFGDFVNAAQVIIDQFIAAAESKWQRASGIVLLLPHGYEGQGPEHSSARLERFLQLCAEDNLQVVHPTTPAQMFHVLRRQMRRPFRTPLVVMTPKSLLRHPRAVSSLTDLAEGRFQPLIDDAAAEPARVRRLLFCSGKVFYALVEAREQRGVSDVALVRIEELYPFPTADVQKGIARYPGGADAFWVQEEPANQGAWTFVRPLLTARLGGRRLRYVGRAEAASPATGSHAAHQDEERALVAEALGIAQAAAAA